MKQFFYQIGRGSILKLFSTILFCFFFTMCGGGDSILNNENLEETEADNRALDFSELPLRSGDKPETTNSVPHMQIGVSPVTAVNIELYRRVYSIQGIEQRASVVAGWQGLWLTDDVTIVKPNAVLGDREFAHIHDDGSLHIFLEPARAREAVDKCWGVLHPAAIGRTDELGGFMMLYTPQSIDELNVTFQLIVDGFNYVTGQNIVSTDYY